MVYNQDMRKTHGSIASRHLKVAAKVRHTGLHFFDMWLIVHILVVKDVHQTRTLKRAASIIDIRANEIDNPVVPEYGRVIEQEWFF